MQLRAIRVRHPKRASTRNSPPLATFDDYDDPCNDMLDMQTSQSDMIPHDTPLRAIV